MLEGVAVIVDCHGFTTHPRNSLAHVLNRLTNIDDNYISRMGKSQGRTNVCPNMRDDRICNGSVMGVDLSVVNARYSLIREVGFCKTSSTMKRTYFAKRQPSNV